MKAKKYGLEILKRLLALGLCLALLAGAALAENVSMKQFYTNEGDYIYFLRTLRDGRMLFTGVKCPDNDGDIHRKWFLCLNPDHTVSWEYVTPEPEASTPYYAEERPDGTIAVMFDMGDEDHAAPEGAKTKIRFYNAQDGQPTGRELDLPENAWVNEGLSWIMMDSGDPAEGSERVTVMDWDGNRIGELGEAEMRNGIGRAVKTDDGFILFGSDAEQNGRAVIRRMKGEPFKWEMGRATVMEHLWDDSYEARVDDLVLTPDGGYAALVNEAKMKGFSTEVWRNILVKFDAEGNTRPLYANDSEREFISDRILLIGGKIVLYIAPDIMDENKADSPRVFQWFDSAGEDLGTTELVLKPEDFPSVQPFLAPADGSEPATFTVGNIELFAGADGLWAVVDVSAGRRDEDDCYETIDGSEDIVLIKIPEV